MYVQKMKLKCDDCFKPATRRLANFKAKDDYVCYSESYVKCFWSLCDHQKSTHDFITTPKEKVVTNQPLRRDFLTPAAIKDVIIIVN